MKNERKPQNLDKDRKKKVMSMDTKIVRGDDRMKTSGTATTLKLKSYKNSLNQDLKNQPSNKDSLPLEILGSNGTIEFDSQHFITILAEKDKEIKKLQSMLE